MANIKEMAAHSQVEPRLGSGHSLCRGCGIPSIVRTVLSSIPGPVAVINATGCLEVATTRYPFTAWKIPWMHVAFENSAAVASGVEAAYRALKIRGELSSPMTLVVFAGDGGTYDIGLQALSGALERGHRFIYVCYDNEAYMNTGIQRSSATPFGASTTTSPAGPAAIGKPEPRKNIIEIVAAHRIPYVAQAAMSHWQDLSNKVQRAFHAEGPAFLNVLSACPPGWGHEPRDAVRVVRLAVDSGYWPLVEVIEGHWRLTYKPPQRVPVMQWLTLQNRFRHLFQPGQEEALEKIQAIIDDEWEAMTRRDADNASWFATEQARPWEVVPTLPESWEPRLGEPMWEHFRKDAAHPNGVVQT